MVTHGVWLGICVQMCWLCQEGLSVGGTVWLQWQPMVGGAVGCFWHGVGICWVCMGLERDRRNPGSSFCYGIAV